MISEDTLIEIWAPLRYELTRDYVSLWEIVGRVRRVLPDADDEVVRSAVLEAIKRGLELGDAEAGTHPQGRDGLEHVWDIPAEQALRRIDDGWSALARDPLPGEVVWLQAPRRHG